MSFRQIYSFDAAQWFTCHRLCIYFSLHNTIILCVLIFVVFTSGGAILTLKTLRRLPLNADYLENKLRTPFFFFPDLESALNFASENRGF